MNISKAIYQSIKVFFYTLAENLGNERIAKYATMLGLGQKTGVDLPQEVSGVMPSEEWKIRNFKQKWYAGETISVARFGFKGRLADLTEMGALLVRHRDPCRTARLAQAPQAAGWWILPRSLSSY